MGSVLLDGLVSPAAQNPPTGGGPVTPGPYSQASISSGQPVGTAPLTGTHNQTLHVAIVGLFALGTIVYLHHLGFHLISVGRYAGGR